MNNKHLIGIYPGTFDPITFGHLEIIKRSANLVDKLIIGIADNPIKGTLLTLEARVLLVRQTLDECDADYSHIEIKGFDNLLMDFAKNNNANMIIRGLRGSSDFDYEFQMAGMNRYIAEDIETVFLMPSQQHHFVASSFVREFARLGSDISKFVPKHVVEFLEDNK